MTRIVAGVFDDNATAERVAKALRAIGFEHEDIDIFAINPPGRHNGLPLGGDVDTDAGAAHGETGALSGAAIGGAVGAVAGLVATPLIGPVAIAGGLAAGAYAGSLAGAMHSLGEPVERGEASNVVRQAGMMVAVRAGFDEDEEGAAATMREHGAQTIEWADGIWRDGHWSDFDPVAKPGRIESHDVKTQPIAPGADVSPRPRP